jgi:hypothetical protein
MEPDPARFRYATMMVGAAVALGSSNPPAGSGRSAQVAIRDGSRTVAHQGYAGQRGLPSVWLLSVL